MYLDLQVSEPASPLDPGQETSFRSMAEFSFKEVLGDDILEVRVPKSVKHS